VVCPHREQRASPRRGAIGMQDSTLPSAFYLVCDPTRRSR
jgi:hypothetical protein